MKTARWISRVGVLLAVFCVLVPPAAVNASSVDGGVLRIREVNITGDEFVVLQNIGSAPLQLDEYWLGYSSDDSTNFVVPSQPLPAITLSAGQSVVLNNGTTSTCDAAVVARLDFSSFSNTKGALQLRRLTNTADISTFTTVDSVTWGKLATDQIQIADEKQLTEGATAVWYKNLADSTSAWRVGEFMDCSLMLVPVSTNSTAPPEVITWPVDITSPPSIYIGSAGTSKATTPYIPAADKGLKAPQLSEILPNTVSPQTDANDEFIELYNPNNKSFDLSGFMLQTASTTSSTTHTYRIPAGTKIAPGAFMAFKSSQTHVSLSNSGGQVWLVDPLGTALDTCDPYGTAKDGHAWVDASGHWQWTTMPTPGTTNKVATPLTNTSSTKTATVNGKKVTAVNAKSANGATLGASTAAASATAQPLSIHPLTLAVIIIAALLYGAYEYRHDVALKYHQLRRNRAARR